MVTPGQRAVARCDMMGSGRFSDMDAGLYRPYLGPAHMAAIEQVGQWMQDAGMTTRVDPAGNLIGRLGDHAKTLIIASHIDSVRDGGFYDGPLGVMLGIECVEALRHDNLPFAIEVYAFGDEEGSRFPASMLCSRAVCGQIDASALEVAGRDGVSLRDALTGVGLDVSRFLDARRDPADLIGYLEAHIEQGPMLESLDLPLGVVTSIAAQKRFTVISSGIAGHAGTNSMALRSDALTAAAEMVLAAERLARGGTPDLVATVGSLSVEPGAANVVPGYVPFTLDVRAGSDEARDVAANEILVEMQAIANRRGTDFEAYKIHDLPAAPCNPALTDILELAVASNGDMPHRMVSGAGHDAMAFASVTPTVMLFIRCKDGTSHNPLESVTAEDAEAAFSAMRNFIRMLADARV
jgi:allantoate deiminase